MELLTIPGLDNSQRLRQMREESRKRMMSESRQKQAMMALAPCWTAACAAAFLSVFILAGGDDE